MSQRTAASASPGSGLRPARALAVAALSAALVLGTPATSHAQTDTRPDAVGDMARDTGAGLVPAPKRTANDASNTVLTHGVRRVTIRIDYVDLVKAANEFQGLWMHVKTNEGVRRYIYLGAGPRFWPGSVQLADGRERPVRTKLRHSIDYEANVVRVSFPRRAASHPSWVRFQIMTWAEGMGGAYLDDALRDGPMTDELSGQAWSNRVYREPAA